MYLPPFPLLHMVIFHSYGARYFIFEGNGIVLPATMNALLSR